MPASASWEQRLALLMPPEAIRQYNGPLVANTPDWYQARRGRVTASKRAETIAVGDTRAWAKMLVEIEYELSDSYVREPISSAAMDWGKNKEAEAIANADLELGAECIEPGFLLHPKYDYAGATPDFFIGEEISGQIKCPYNPQNHLKFIYDKSLPRTYYHQVNFEAWVSQRPKIIFMSYDPRQPLATRCAIIELERSQELWDTFDRRLEDFRRVVDHETAPPANGRVVGFANGIPSLF